MKYELEYWGILMGTYEHTRYMITLPVLDYGTLMLAILTLTLVRYIQEDRMQVHN